MSGSIAVSRELWVSFASLLRAYAAGLAQVVPGLALDAQASEDSLIVFQLGGNRLDVRYGPDDGAGRWVLNDAESGGFSFTEDGLVSLDERAPVEMDAAAELLTARLL